MRQVVYNECVSQQSPPPMKRGKEMIRIYDVIRIDETSEELYRLSIEGEEFNSEDHYMDHISWNLDAMILRHSEDEENQSICRTMIDHLTGRIANLGAGRIEIISYQSWGGIEYLPVVIFEVK
jgi:ribosome biogenesis GTPase A